MASESFFDNTAFFHTTYGILHFNPDSGNSLVLLFFSNGKLFPFGFLLDMLNAIWSFSDETCILPKPDILGKWKWFFITNYLVMDTPFIYGIQPHNPKASGTQQVILYVMIFYHYSMLTACPSL